MWKLFFSSLVLGIPLAVMLVMLAAFHESRQPPGGGASFETLVAVMMSIPIYFVVFPLTYLGLAKALPAEPGAPLARSTHLRVFAGFAVGVFVLGTILAYPYSFTQPMKTAGENVVLVGIFTLQFIAYFTVLEHIRVR